MYNYKLNHFSKLIDSIFGPNVVIGGMTALALHGLITRPAEDIDLIIYQPNIRLRRASPG